MDKKNISIKKILLVMMILIVMSAGIFVLTRPAKGIVLTKSELPLIGSTPVYVELTDGVTLEREYIPSADMHVNNIKVLFVNTNETNNATIDISVITRDGEEIVNSTESIAAFTVGEWTNIGVDMNLMAGQSYKLLITPNGANPFFMQVDGYGLDISLGFEYITDSTVSYGDVFYYSIPLFVFICVLLLGIALFGIDRLVNGIKSLDFANLSKKYGCIVFLLMLFVALAVKIMSVAYAKGVYITSDSDGYLREAVNLLAGNGYSYDGIAGYSSWFANWPIIYPLFIAFIALITGTNVYLASKIVAILCFGIIEIVLYIAFKKDSWLYALTLTNLGVLAMAYNTWSEIPFMVFMLIFGVALGKIVTDVQTGISTYLLLGIAGTCTFLTRYFGVFAWCSAGIYWLLLVINWWKSAGSECKRGIKNHVVLGDKKELARVVKLAVTAAISAMIYIAYLMMNKVMNGNPTGVSRGTWWDDYKSLTDDLVRSLVTEIFNVFSIDVPKIISEKPVFIQVWFVVIVTIIIGALIHRCLKDRGDILHRYMSTECVFIMMAIVYYGMFIVIRYRSSMDTFYFRFFAPATFLLCIGLIGLLLKACKGRQAIPYIATFVSVMTIASFVYDCGSTNWTSGQSYYDITVAGWDRLYSEIPQKSVVIWSDLDYRSTWYRADVIDGELFGDDTPVSLRDRYYGSDYLCIQKDYVITILEEGDYEDSLRSLLGNALDNVDDTAKYICIPLN